MYPDIARISHFKDSYEGRDSMLAGLGALRQRVSQQCNFVMGSGRRMAVLFVLIISRLPLYEGAMQCELPRNPDVGMANPQSAVPRRRSLHPSGPLTALRMLLGLSAVPMAKTQGRTHDGMMLLPVSESSRRCQVTV